LFGDYDDLKSPLHAPADVDFICFTDGDLEVPGWRMRRVAADGFSPNLQAKHFKFFPHVHLADYEASLFVDASIVLHGEVDAFVARWLAHENFAMWQHPQRCDAFEEVAAIVLFEKARPQEIAPQADFYRKAGLPRGTGLMEACFIWRRHDHAPVRELMSLWWDEVSTWTLRDQVSLCFLMWRTGTRPKALPPALGNARENPLCFIAPHRPGRPRPAKTAKRVVFLYRDDHRFLGSTILRGQQLAEIAGREMGVLFSSDTACRDAVVFMTKGFLKNATEAELTALKAANVALLADFLDDPVRPQLLPHIDLLIAPSIEGWRLNLWKYAETDCDLLTHHVDLRIPADGARTDAFAAGYFGEGVNALRTKPIEDMVDFVNVDTRFSDPAWIGRLNDYNLHYAVRSGVEGTHTKPFLKGFIAARCGANMIVSRGDGDALHYLGADYPYLLDSADPDAAADMVRRARESFGGPDWRRGLEIMRTVRERSSTAQVRTELGRILRRWI
jgi:hypothetical protein